MPIYDYKCNKCDNIQELFHHINDSPKFKCAQCGHNKATKQIGAPVIAYFDGCTKSIFKHYGIDPVTGKGTESLDASVKPGVK